MSQKPSPGDVVFYYFLDAFFIGGSRREVRLISRPAIVISVSVENSETINLFVFFDGDDVEVDPNYHHNLGDCGPTRSDVKPYHAEASMRQQAQTWSWHTLPVGGPLS